MALKRDRSLRAWGRNAAGELGDGNFVAPDSPVRIGTVSWRSVAVRWTVLQGDGSLYTWGDNGTGQLGNEGAWTPEPVWIP